MCVVSHKTTVHLSDEMKAALESEARRRGVSEAEVIRRAIANLVARPKPRAGFIDSQSIAEQGEGLLNGFGGR